MSIESEASEAEHQEHVSDLFDHCSLAIYFLHASWLSSIITGRFCNIWGSKSTENIWTVAEPGLVDSPRQCTGAYCFISGAIFGH